MNAPVSDHQSQHETVVHRLYEEVWTNTDFSNLGKFIAPQIDFHFRGQTFAQTPENLAQIVKRWHEAFSDLQFEVQAVVVDGDLAAARVRYRGIHQGEWKGLAATGRSVEVHEMLFFRFQDGRIVEVWEVTDEHALRQQLTIAEA